MKTSRKVAADAIAAELSRRRDLRRVLAKLTAAGPGVTLVRLRHHLRLYAGAELARATDRELTILVDPKAIRLVTPRSLDDWEKRIGIPPEPPWFRHQAPWVKRDEGVPDVEPGALVRSRGVHRQSPDPDAHYMPAERDPGNRVRSRRMLSYLERMSAYLAGRPPLSNLERDVLEHLVAGGTVRSIAGTLGIGRNTVHAVIARHRHRGGVPGPGPGR